MAFEILDSAPPCSKPSLWLRVFLILLASYVWLCGLSPLTVVADASACRMASEMVYAATIRTSCRSEAKFSNRTKARKFVARLSFGSEVVGSVASQLLDEPELPVEIGLHGFDCVAHPFVGTAIAVDWW